MQSTLPVCLTCDVVEIAMFPLRFRHIAFLWGAFPYHCEALNKTFSKMYHIPPHMKQLGGPNQPAVEWATVNTLLQNFTTSKKPFFLY